MELLLECSVAIFKLLQCVIIISSVTIQGKDSMVFLEESK